MTVNAAIGTDGFVERPSNSLTGRHVSFIALGGAIGAGLFLGSASAIVEAGPGVLFAYAIAGSFAFLIARALGELTLNRPIDGSFVAYADLYFGRWCGFVTGWSYWLSWLIVGMAELTAAGIFARFWLPDFPQWLTALLALLALFGANVVNVRLFGELEFWLALVKVVAVLSLLIVGVVLIAAHIPVNGDVPSVTNLWQHGGILPHGLVGVTSVLPIAFFGFGGIELIGLTASETDDPRRSIPRAVNSVVARILIFYVGSLGVIMALLPWNEIDKSVSPFVLVLDRIGFVQAASMLNLVVMSAVLSSCNSGLFATGRVLATLAAKGHAPRVLAARARRLPVRAITASAAMMGASIILNYAVPSRAFAMLLAVAALLLMWNWLVIAGAHLRYRREIAAAGRSILFPMPFYPVSNWLIIGFILAIVLLMITLLSMAVAVLSIAAWFVLLTIVYFGRRRFQKNGRAPIGLADERTNPLESHR